MNNNNNLPLNLEFETEKLKETDLNINDLKTNIVTQAKQFYVDRSQTLKDQVNLMGAEIVQRQNKMKLLSEIIATINNLTDEKNCVDISKDNELLEKIQAARELGVKIKEGQTVFNHLERDRLIENLQLSTDIWDKENRHQIQKVEIHTKHLDHVMLLLNDLSKKHDQALTAISRGMKH